MSTADFPVIACSGSPWDLHRFGYCAKMNDPVIVSFGCPVDIPEKRDPQWRNRLHQFGMWLSLWDIFFIG